MELQERAMDNLRYIRLAMERAGSFTAVPGLGGTLMGCTALVAAALAARQLNPVRWLAIWVAEAGLALLIGLAAPARKSARASAPAGGAEPAVFGWLSAGDGSRGSIDARVVSGERIPIPARHLAAAIWRRCGVGR